MLQAGGNDAGKSSIDAEGEWQRCRKKQHRCYRQYRASGPLRLTVHRFVTRLNTTTVFVWKLGLLTDMSDRFILPAA